MQRKQDLELTFASALLAIAMIALVAMSIYSRPAAAQITSPGQFMEVEWNERNQAWMRSFGTYVYTHNDVPNVRISISNPLRSNEHACVIIQVTEVLESNGNWRQISRIESRTPVSHALHVQFGGEQSMADVFLVNCYPLAQGSRRNEALLGISKPRPNSNLKVRFVASF